MTASSLSQSQKKSSQHSPTIFASSPSQIDLQSIFSAEVVGSLDAELVEATVEEVFVGTVGSSFPQHQS